jgi:hypothetical protein
MRIERVAASSISTTPSPIDPAVIGFWRWSMLATK